MLKIARLLAFLCASCCVVNAAPPNIVILIADDLGQRDLGCYNGQTFYETPALDRFAKQGVLFSQGYAANPVCSPTRYALQTGKWPTRAGLTSYLVDDRAERFQGAPLTRQIANDEVTFADVVRKAGYRNIFIGKWHLGEKPENWPEAHGYDVNIAGCSQGHPASWFSPYKNPRLTDGPPGEYLTTRLADETIAQLKEAKKTGKPFLLCHAFYEVHTPMQAPAELIQKYKSKAAKLGLKGEFSDDTQIYISAKSPRKVRQNQTVAEYAAKIEAMDQSAGRILHALDDLGLSENTLVVFTSDNGGLSTSEGSPTSNVPFRGGKGWLYEGGLRVPFLIRWPGVAQAGKVDTTPITTLDLFPTIIHASGEKSGACDGQDLAPLLTGKSGNFTTRDLFWHFPHYGNQGGFPGAVIRSGDWKLIENFEDGSLQLYNLANDQGEKNDLAKSEPKRVTEMKARLHAWYQATHAKFLRAKGDGPQPWQPE